MRDRPNAADLLDIARETIERRFLPELAPALRYTGLMVVSALANAQREIEAGEAPLDAELMRLAKFYGEAPTAASADAVRAALDRLNRRLVADIRAGRLDGEAAIAAHLLATAADAVRESNPKYLAGRPIEGPPILL